MVIYVIIDDFYNNFLIIFTMVVFVLKVHMVSMNKIFHSNNQKINPLIFYYFYDQKFQ